MKIYTIERMNKFDYDFSVEVTKHGCYSGRSRALEKAKKEYESMCAEYEDQMVKYSDADIYVDEDSGALYIEEDSENGYYCITFGADEHYESHVVYVEEWDLEEDDEHFGVVRWCIEDIQQTLMNSGYKGTIEQAATILPYLEHHGFTDHMISAGWEYIECTIGNHEDNLINLEE